MDDMPDDALGIDAATTALLVIDMQRDFCDPRGYAAQAGLDTAAMARTAARVRVVLDAARAAGLLVVHTREGHAPDLSDCWPAKRARSRAVGAEIGSPGPLGRLLVRGEYGHDFIDELAPRADERVVDKPGYGAFYRTNLQPMLVAAGIRTLLLCGVTLEVCVHSTLREAVDRGFRCIVVGDACAAGDPALRDAALAMVGTEGGIFGAVVSADEVAAWLAGAGAGAA